MTQAARTTGSTRRSPGAVPSSTVDSVTASSLPRRDRILIYICIALVSVLAWAYLIHLDREMSSEMAFHAAMGMSMMDIPWTMTDGVLTFAMWTVMMVGMMAGSAAPVLLLFAASRAKRAEPGARLAVLMFGLGYFAVWTGFSALAAIGQWALHSAAMLADTMAASSPYLAGAILIGAGIYQLTPWKGACLTHCRSPLGFLMSHWRDGHGGAFQMGLRHGMYCLGCCWALMIVLFVVGVMNLVWVAMLTGLVLIEKVGRTGIMVSRLAGAVMVAVGILKIVGS
jgi:predicted metal-binding membrane protein